MKWRDLLDNIILKDQDCYSFDPFSCNEFIRTTEIHVDEKSSVSILVTSTQQLQTDFVWHCFVIIKKGAQVQFDCRIEHMQLYAVKCIITFICYEQSQLKHILYSKNMKDVLYESSYCMDGSGSFVEVVAIADVQSGQKHAFITRQKHSASETQTCVDVKSIVAGGGLMTYDAAIFLPVGSIKAYAHQGFKALLLEPGAKAYARPSLQVDHKDVSCSHGAAISHIDELMVWYLQSRSLPQKKASELIIEGFLN